MYASQRVLIRYTRMRVALQLSALMLIYGDSLAAHELKIVEPSDIIGLDEVGSAQISPDGATVAYVIDAASGQHIWVVPTTGGERSHRLFAGDGSDFAPAWAPDGKVIAFLRDTPASSDEKSGRQIWIIPGNGGGAKMLTPVAGNVRRFRWSHDGRFLAFLRKDQETEEDGKSRANKQDVVVRDTNYAYSRLWIYDFSNRQATLLTTQDVNIIDFDWAPDGSRLAATVSATPRTDDVENQMTVMIFDAALGDISKVLPVHASEHDVHWSPDGRRIALFKLAPTTDAGIPIVYDVDTGAETVLGQSSISSINDLLWSADGKSVIGSALTGTRWSIVTMNARSGITSDIEPLEGSVGKLSASRDGGKLAYVEETPKQPGQVFMFSGGRERKLTSVNSEVSSWNLGASKELSWKSTKDGKTIHGVLLLPPNYDSEKRYKTVVHLHGGPVSAWDLGFHGSWYDWGLVLASHGFVVLLPNPRGSEGSGLKFAQANDRDWGGSEFQDVMDGVDHLISQNIVDPNRLGIGGWSYGGFLTAWIVTHTDRFKTAIAGAAMTDLFSMATTTDIAPSFLSRYFGDLASNRASYDEHSPARFLEYCHTPTLVLDGEVDARVPISQGAELYNGLRFLGRETQMVQYPREAHFFSEKAHQRDSLERMLQWYQDHLGR
jgi:dipeptidyl aminopeptidase/acylaminoacyl peptidase